MQPSKLSSFNPSDTFVSIGGVSRTRHSCSRFHRSHYSRHMPNYIIHNKTKRQAQDRFSSQSNFLQGNALATAVNVP